LLAPRIGRAARGRFPGHTIATLVLPTEWARGPSRVAAAVARIKPDIAIHFGVSPLAKGFVIERRGVNACVATPDGAGHLPSLAVLDPDGPGLRAVTLPVVDIVKRLKAVGLPVATSDDAGQYLCNAVLYSSLTQGAQGGMKAGFVHIPASLAGGGPDQRAPMPGCQLTHAELIDGSLELIAACLERP
jgi:pyroglutamyl-peptidase